MKRSFLFLFLCSGLLSAMYSCFCKQERPYWVMKSIFPLILNNDNTILLSDTIETDTLFIRIQIKTLFTSQSSHSITPFLIAQARAFQCVEPGGYGLKNKLTAFKIISSVPFNQFLAGDDISSICSINGLPISAYLSNSTLPNFDFTVTINNKPNQIITRDFGFQFAFENNTQVEGITSQVVWK